MGRRSLGASVFDKAIDRMIPLYEEGHRILVSFSAGKDSGTCLEVCMMAAQVANRLPVEVVMRDEEIMYPGTYEYAERVAKRDGVIFHWFVANQPIVNVFNRREPYFWVFDTALRPDQWVREPPSFAKHIPDLNIERMITPARFPPSEGKKLLAVLGLRGQESARRMMGLHSSGGYITRPNGAGVQLVRPIYDWTDGDVWKAHADYKWDYNRAYDAMHRMGVPRRHLRIAPPTLNAASMTHLSVAASAWPRWFDKVCERLPGVRTAAMFGARAVTPTRRLGETWEQTFDRECVSGAPADWIRERATKVRDGYLRDHKHHATTPFPEVKHCEHCSGAVGSWRNLTLAMYNGDPFCLKVGKKLPYVEPEFFRAGAGTWGGSPTWTG